LIGNNGEGKTNILEAIYYLATGRSHLGSRDSELIQWGASSFSIRGEVEKRNSRSLYDVSFSDSGKKKIRINKKDIHKLSELIGQFFLVMFSPETLKIVQGSPQDRRKYLDFSASQSNSQYFFYLQQYHKILMQRNQLLKNHSRNPDLEESLLVWDEQLIEYGSELIKRRDAFIRQLEKVVIPVHQKMTGKQENIRIDYQSSIGEVALQPISNIKGLFETQLKRTRKIEKIRGHTLVGPHRDDIKIISNDNDLHRFGSQGQQRTAALSLKLAEVEMLFQETNEKPILLLDDVMSELDDDRRMLLLELINGSYQTIITSTNLNPFKELDPAHMSVFNVRSGTVVRC